MTDTPPNIFTPFAPVAPPHDPTERGTPKRGRSTKKPKAAKPVKPARKARGPRRDVPQNVTDMIGVGQAAKKVLAQITEPTRRGPAPGFKRKPASEGGLSIATTMRAMVGLSAEEAEIVVQLVQAIHKLPLKSQARAIVSLREIMVAAAKECVI